MKIPEPFKFTTEQVREIGTQYADWKSTDPYAFVTERINGMIAAHYKKMFEGAIEVYGFFRERDTRWGSEQINSDTHRAILLKPELILKGVDKETLVKTLRDISESFHVSSTQRLAKALVELIEEGGIR